MDTSDLQLEKHATNAVLVALVLLVFQRFVTEVDVPLLVSAAVLYFVVLVGFDALKSARSWGPEE